MRNAKSTSRIYDELGNQRKDIAWIASLRMGHCSLNDYLHRFHIIDNSTCECGNAKETVRHFLLICPLHQRERDKLRKKVRVVRMRMEQLLGDPRRVKYTIEFIDTIKRFDF